MKHTIYYRLCYVDNSKTGKAGEVDMIIGIGKTGSSEVENNVSMCAYLKIRSLITRYDKL